MNSNYPHTKHGNLCLISACGGPGRAGETRGQSAINCLIVVGGRADGFGSSAHQIVGTVHVMSIWDGHAATFNVLPLPSQPPHTAVPDVNIPGATYFNLLQLNARVLKGDAVAGPEGDQEAVYFQGDGAALLLTHPRASGSSGSGSGSFNTNFSYAVVVNFTASTSIVVGGCTGLPATLLVWSAWSWISTLVL